MFADRQLQRFYSDGHYAPICNDVGSPCLVSNPKWSRPFICILFINLITLGTAYLIHQHPKKDSNLYLRLTIICLAVLDVSYLLTQFVNPGIAEPTLEFKLQKSRCEKCGIYNENASHCSECGVCIQDLDHHCSWFGKCIGSGNKYFFYLFLTSVFALWADLLFALTYVLDM